MYNFAFLVSCYKMPWLGGFLQLQNAPTETIYQRVDLPNYEGNSNRDGCTYFHVEASTDKPTTHSYRLDDHEEVGIGTWPQSKCGCNRTETHSGERRHASTSSHIGSKMVEASTDKTTTDCLSGKTTPATQNQRRCRQAPRLPRKSNMDVSLSKCHGHACDAKCRSETKVDFAKCHTRRRNVDVSKWHACYAKQRLMWASATPAT